MTQKTYWDNLGPGYQFYSTSTLEMIGGFILANKCQSVFEASTGTGYFPKLLRDSGYMGEYLGSDYCDSFLGWARENNPKENFIKIDLGQELPVSVSRVDVSVVHHGLDYVYPYRTALKELARVSKKYVVVTLWQKFDKDNHIRFTKQGGWNVNIYRAEEWYDEISSIFKNIIVDAEIVEWNDKYSKFVYNHLFVLQV